MTLSLVPNRLLCVLLALCLGASVAAAAYANDIDRVNSLLRRAETNLESVAASVQGRTSPPRGSAGKLLARRLEMALGDINPAKDLLEKIPAGTEGRAEAVERYTAAANEYNRLRAFLTGSDAPAEPETGTKLDYRQEELLRNATFHIREVEGNAQVLTERTEQLRAIDDQLSINFRDVNGLREVVANAQRKAGFANDTLGQLPADGRGVSEARQRLVNAQAKVVTAEDYLRPLDARLEELIDPANYPEFDTDYKRLRELSIMFARPEMFQTQPVLAGETFEQGPAAKDECLRIARKYARLIQQGTAQGEQIEGVGNGFLQNHAEYLAEAERQKAALPGQIREHIATARRYGDEAVAEQKPLWFTGGIPQVMGFADEKITLLTALDASAGAAMRGQFDQAQADLKQQADSLRELIIRENTMPGDNFQGADRDEAIKIAISGWKVQQEEFELLKVRIPAQAWARETKWTYSNGTWYFSDRSKLQVRLLVADKDNPELAIDRPINVWKDHQKGDTMIGVPLFGIDDELQPSDYMLRTKIE
ncbi:MAG: hypothetical protein RIE77_04905 [Phycisphaerales bacterium]|jgi:hypothetical protein